MKAFEKQKTKDGFTVKLWRGERMCLIGFNVEEPEDDFVGFAIEVKAPGAKQFVPLYNRLAFSYDEAAGEEMDGSRNFSCLKAPFQKFRWIHFPWNVKKGDYKYRATKMHMPSDGKPLKKGTSITLAISLNPVTYDDFLDVGFTRNFASSQAFRDHLGNPQDINEAGKKIIPSEGDKGLEFKKAKGDIYDWMGFEAYDLIFGFLDEVAEAIKQGRKVTLDMFAYDFNEPDILARLKGLKKNLRVIIDDSAKKKDDIVTGHGSPDSPESRAAKQLEVSAGSGNVKRLKFKNLQHNKVFIAREDGVPYKVLGGSTNFTFRGLYIQANNTLVFDDQEIAGLFGRYFDTAFENADTFNKTELATSWHVVKKAKMPAVHICFSPHKDTNLSLAPVAGAIAQASSSVLYAVAFLYQMGAGLTKDEFDRLMERPIFSHGISDKSGKLELQKPDGSKGMVDFEYLAENAPEPFKSEWSGGKGINVHHKFVVTDFNLPTAKVFMGSSNLSPSGERRNGDHLIMIGDQRVATAYAIEALRVFDHLHFRVKMKEESKKGSKSSKKKKVVIKLQKPKAISGAKTNWFESSYVPGSQKEKDRKIFSGID